MAFPVDQTALVALFVESITYGICVVMSVATLMIFLRINASGKLIHPRLLSVLVLMLVIATAHIVLSFIRVFAGFIHHGDNITAYFQSVGNPLVVSKDCFLLIQIGLGDSVNIWRCFIVFGRKWWVIAFPLVLLVAGFVTSVLLLVNQSPNAVIFSETPAIGTAFDTLTMVTNVYCTTAMTWKIWTTANFTTRVSNLRPIILFILETSALYTSTLVIWLITNLVKSLAEFVVTDMLSPLIPSVFCLLILQVKFHQFSDSLEEPISLNPQESSATQRRMGTLRRREPRADIGLSTSRARPVEVAIEISKHADDAGHPSDEDESHTQKNTIDLADMNIE
ncbi:hypothetical protein DENSPDRAFT_694893 [Dentipellis sp. KUC8613]|nr:hypothetical protein DENSPDRAFT_694893 [Dentipellis sp. KUC8613]